MQTLQTTDGTRYEKDLIFFDLIFCSIEPLVVELNACKWPTTNVLPKGKDNLDFEEDIDELESEESSESDDEQVSAKDTIPGLEEESINFALSGFYAL